MSDNIFKRGPSQLQRAERELKKLESELHQECRKVVFSAVTHAFDVDPADPELPAEWLAELGDCVDEEERASKLRDLNRRRRIATYALLPPKEAPVALQIAAKVLGGMDKADAMKGAAPRELNLTLVSFPAPDQSVPMFPVKEIKNE